MALQFAEVVLVRIPFHQAPSSKFRPALVLLDSRDEDFVAAPVTSQVKPSPFELEIRDWSAAGLNVPSCARVNKLTVLSKESVIRGLGTLSEADNRLLLTILCRTFCQSEKTESTPGVV